MSERRDVRNVSEGRDVRNASEGRDVSNVGALANGLAGLPFKVLARDERDAHHKQSPAGPSLFEAALVYSQALHTHTLDSSSDGRCSTSQIIDST